MERVYQEFYCAKSGGGCGGYILVQLNPGINGVVEVICPKCKHEHQRNIKDGRIIEQGRYKTNGKPKERLRPPISAWSEIPSTKAAHKMQKAIKKRSTSLVKERDAHVISGRRDFLKERWFEIHGVTPPS